MASRSVSVAPGGAHQVTGDTAAVPAGPQPAWVRGEAWYAANTGVPSGTTLSDVARADGYYYSAAGELIEGERITVDDGSGTAFVDAANITFRNCEIHGHVQHLSGSATFDRCTFVGQNVAADACILYGGMDLTQCQIYGWPQGIKATYDMVIADCWIHTLIGPPTHAETVLMEQADNVQVLRCWLDATKLGGTGVSGAIAAYGGTQPAGLHNLVFDENHLMGSGYLMYMYDGSRATAPSNIQVTNNTFHESGPEAYGSLEGSAALDAGSLAMWANNKRVVVDAGTDVGPPSLYGG